MAYEDLRDQCGVNDATWLNNGVSTIIEDEAIVMKGHSK